MCADQAREKARLSDAESSTKKTDSNEKPEKGNDVTDETPAASATGTDDKVGQQEQVTESKSSTLEGQLLLLQYTGCVQKVLR